MNHNDDDYKDALEYLYSFVDFSLQKATTYSPARFKLERMQALVEALGNPQQAYPIIHVAGTKGKGSVSVLCASALLAAGYKVGLYTSPHLDDYAERIQINGEFISHAELADLVDEIKPFVAAIPELTTFEITTALAFMYFAKQGVSAGVIEVGLGGRLDATNVVIPEVSVITSISYDHTHLLGNTLAEIAGEKAGIIKPNIPVVVAPQEEEARLVIEQVARDRSSPLLQVGRDLLFEEVSHSLEGQKLRVWSPGQGKQNSSLLSIPLLGPHQVVNAATAYASLDSFRQKGFNIDQDEIIEGFDKAFWPGRFEIIQNSPPVILDCAHNRDSASKLRLTLEEYFPGKPVVNWFLEPLKTRISRECLSNCSLWSKNYFWLSHFTHVPLNHQNWWIWLSHLANKVHITYHIPDALEKAIQLAGKEMVVLVTGSIFVVAEARKYLERIANIRRY